MAGDATALARNVNRGRASSLEARGLPISPGIVSSFSSSARRWGPDGQRVAFSATGAGAPGIYVKNVHGGNAEPLLQSSTNEQAPSDRSRDGRWLVFTETDPETGADIWLLADPSTPPAEGRKPVALLHTPALESQGQISPDGKWLAYVSNESGTSQVYLRPFAGLAPAPDTLSQVSTTRSQDLRWRADGKELLYLDFGTARRYKVMSVPIGAAPNPAGTPKLLFEFQSVQSVAQRNSFLCSSAADGQRFLVNVYATDAQPSLEVILNWGRAPGGQ